MSELEPIRVLIADDHAIVRKGIRAVLEIVPDIEVTGQTPGKALLGLTVVRADRGPLRQGAAVVPWLGYWLSGILFLGYLWILVDDRRQGWHDKLARTLVV